jgi:hypothetical protein
MHFKSLRHVRDHVKVQGRAYDLLTYIALHTNMHTGEAFELTIERQALRHQLTPEWTRILLNGVIATGELVVERSRGRHLNRYRFPLERCPACQDANPEVELGVEESTNPELPPPQPPTGTPPTPNSGRPQHLGKVLRFPGVEPQTAPRKEVIKNERRKTWRAWRPDDPEDPTPPRCVGYPSPQERKRYCDYHRQTHFSEW